MKEEQIKAFYDAKDIYNKEQDVYILRIFFTEKTLDMCYEDRLTKKHCRCQILLDKLKNVTDINFILGAYEHICNNINWR